MEKKRWSTSCCGAWAGSARPSTALSYPRRRLLTESPATESEPVQSWLSNLPDNTPLTMLGRPTKPRWRIEHDYCEVQQALGPSHFEDLTWSDWHHHVTLVSAAHAFGTLHCLARAQEKQRWPDSLPGRPRDAVAPGCLDRGLRATCHRGILTAISTWRVRPSAR